MQGPAETSLLPLSRRAAAVLGGAGAVSALITMTDECFLSPLGWGCS